MWLQADASESAANADGDAGRAAAVAAAPHFLSSIRSGALPQPFSMPPACSPPQDGVGRAWFGLLFS